MDKEVLSKVICMTIIPFIFVALFTPFVKKIAQHIGAMDKPNKRKVHAKPMPRLGGIGIYFGFLLGYMIYGQPTSLMNSVLISSFIIVFVGILDDIKPLKTSTKFIGQLISSMIVVFYGQILIQDISAFGIYIDFWYFSYPLTILFILGCINCMNLIDGLDGLAAGISSIFFCSVGIIAIFTNQPILAYTLSFIMLGSCLGFLVHNFYPATIFMGDSGSMFLGFIIAVITLLGFKNVMMSSLIIPMLIIVVPIMDTLFAIIRRKLKGEKITTPDKYHIHHQLLKRNFSHRTTVIIIYLVTILFSIASLIYVLVDNQLGYIIYGILFFIILIFAIKTDVIFTHEESKNEEK